MRTWALVSLTKMYGLTDETFSQPWRHSCAHFAYRVWFRCPVGRCIY